MPKPPQSTPGASSGASAPAMQETSQHSNVVAGDDTQIALRLYSSLELNETIEHIFELLVSQIQCRYAVYLRYNQEDQTLEYAGSLGINPETTAALESVRIPMADDTSHSYRLLTTMQPLILNSADLEQDFYYQPYVDIIPLTSLLAYPLGTINQPLGIILAANAIESHQIRPEQMHQLARLAPLITQAMQNAITFEQTKARFHTVHQRESLQTVEFMRALRMKDEYFAHMSHELRTPLTSILSITEAMKLGLCGPLSEEQQSMMQLMEDSGQYLLTLLNDTLDLAKIEAGRMELHIEPVDIEEICHKAVQVVKQIAREKGQQVLVQCAKQTRFMHADALRLVQLLVNLLMNAVKNTPQGGQVGLKVSGNRTEKTIDFAVWDKGIGIPSDKLPLLFKPFTQVGSGSIPRRAGTGLGLSLVRRITEMHGGCVTVTSDVGKGSCFTITLPWEDVVTQQKSQNNRAVPQLQAQASADLTIPTEPSQSPEAGSKGRVLVVDDNDVVVIQLSKYFTSLGYEVITAFDGATAIERAIEHSPHLIFMDIQMPGIDGVSATRFLRRQQMTAQTPIIALTALVMPGDRERCLNAGMTDYYNKPISFAKLRAIVERFIDNTAYHLSSHAEIATSDIT